MESVGNRAYLNSENPQDSLLSRHLRATVKLLQLPLKEEEINRGTKALIDNIPDKFKGREVDYAYDLEMSFANWNESGKPSPILKQAVGLLLKDTEVSKRGKGFKARDYFKLLDGLQPEKNTIDGSLSLQTMRRVLSQSLFITSMFTEEKMSCSQVARVIATLESKYIPYQASVKIASAFNIKPTISDDKVLSIIKLDEKDAEDNFPDADLSESYQICERLCQLWVPEINIVTELENLSSPDLRATSYYPYVQILHWATLAVEEYDHPVTYLYEFLPRGAAANTLFKEAYPNVSTQNPFLNLAKAVHRIDYSWLENRTESSAYALVNLLMKIEETPYRARKEVCRIIRAWILRFIQLENPSSCFARFNVDFTAEIARKFSDTINSAETNTHGVIEQRLVDSLALLAFAGNGVSVRGIGDSVNASNFSKKKMGDLEFLNPGAKTSRALEAHSGQVTPGYVSAHLASLARVLELRQQDSPEMLEEKEDWDITVTYVAHSFADGIDALQDEVAGFKITHEFWSYEDLTQKAFEESSDDLIAKIFNAHFRDALNLGNVRQDVRDKANEILSRALNEQ